MKALACPVCAAPLRRLGIGGAPDGSIVEAVIWFHCPQCRAQFYELLGRGGRLLDGIDLVRDSAKRTRPCLPAA